MVFPAVHRTLVADRVEDVVPVLEEVERATEAGNWAFGFIAHEAAAALDPTLAVHPTPAAASLWCGSGSPTSQCRADPSMQLAICRRGRIR